MNQICSPLFLRTENSFQKQKLNMPFSSFVREVDVHFLENNNKSANFLTLNP